MEASESMEALARRMARAYYERKGFEVLTEGWKCPLGGFDLVVYDEGEGCLAFVEVRARWGNLPPERADSERGRALREAAACSFFASYDGADSSVRFDALDIGMLDSGRGFVRHAVGL